MKSRIFLAALFCLPTLALADSSLRAEVNRLDKPVCAAMKAKDMKAFDKLIRPTVTKDFKYSEPGGKPMTYDQMLKGMEMGMSQYDKVTKVATTLVSCTEKGDAGRAVEKHVVVATMKGPDKKSHVMTFEGTAIETYRKVKGKWMMTSMQMSDSKMTMDGKPMPMGG